MNSVSLLSCSNSNAVVKSEEAETKSAPTIRLAPPLGSSSMSAAAALAKLKEEEKKVQLVSPKPGFKRKKYIKHASFKVWLISVPKSDIPIFECRF
jgi:hypothetical protein